MADDALLRHEFRVSAGEEIFKTRHYVILHVFYVIPLFSLILGTRALLRPVVCHHLEARMYMMGSMLFNLISLVD